MRRSMVLAAAALCLALASGGCGRSPQVTFYTLLPVQQVQSPAAGTAAPSIAVGPVTLPEMVDRPQLVVRRGANRVQILEMQRWAEPLKSEIPRFLAQEIGRRLGSNRVSSYRQTTGQAADYRVLVDIIRFESVPGDAVTVEANWVIRLGAGGPPRTGHSVVREKIKEGGYDAVVAAYGNALGALSGDLAAALRAEGAARP